MPEENAKSGELQVEEVSPAEARRAERWLEENRESPAVLDAIIIGGGPAGLSAALVLGRCRRRVLVIDAGEPRSASSRAMHGFITRDGIPPCDFRQIAREQLATYPDVRVLDGRATKAVRGDGHFTVTVEEGRSYTARLLLLATGIVDEVPQIPGYEEFWGRTMHLCPYCDGWEHRDQPLAVYGKGQDGIDFALEMLGWSRDLVLCTDGPSEFEPAQMAQLEAARIPLIETPVAQLEGRDGQVEAVRFADGSAHRCEALFFTAPQRQCSMLAKELGCKISDDGTTLDCLECASTNVPGVYVAGNTSRGLQLVIMAAADGTQAAFTMNQALLEADVPKPEEKPAAQPTREPAALT